MMDAAAKRGGPGRGQGRKPVAEGEPTITVSLRMTAAQRDKVLVHVLPVHSQQAHARCVAHH